MNYSQELLTSVLWLLKTISITAVLFTLLMLGLIKTTRWGHQFWLLAYGYISPKRSFKPLSYFIVIVFFNLVAVRVDILFSEWYKAMYDALQKMDANVFWIQMVVFSVLAAVHIGNILLTYYFTQRFTIQWRTWLNANMVEKWTQNQAYYKSQYVYNQLDNPDQRIQQDVKSFVSSSLSFATGVISSAVSIVAFTQILWTLSGPMTVAGITIPHAMVYFVFIYVLVSSVIAFKIGRPLIHLNFANERLNANYRYSLIRVKEYAESIAFFRGEKMEKSVLFKQFNHVIDNVWKMVYMTLKLSGFNVMMTQISVIFPFIIQASRYFSNQIQLGDLIQTAQSFGRVQSALSYFRNVYDDFTGYRAVLDRLTGFHTAITQATTEGHVVIKDSESAVIFDELFVKKPTGEVLIKALNVHLLQGSSVLIKGPSGSGKTTLLRTIAGLWSFSEGTVYYPLNNALFLSQKPYLPQGRLIDALYYPAVAPENVDLNQAAEIMRQVQLGHLADKLEQENDWTRVLSLGEQQRLSFARVLIHKPFVAFLDEATASMDEGLEDAMYRLLREKLPNTTIISVGHRSTLQRHHQQQLVINPEKKSWELLTS
ncbi:MAG: ABC transporter ATP-binding protein/permease [[Actinobacillus] rossii]|uniref:ABC transporter n=1 Tax=[Actinobacillus] rossii TaxID=123820 RepID=A0A380TNJ3_9PAST|nr:ABC transporter ATP-binding protein/permease [[Actinobacillus] rossii]MDD7425745.1 ABC transporter ATP-binding protein/permease [[Actinobacillus] rossii]MDY3123514.1 ABC transporter ATP-binding protein/permease [[Actinobacillus] rossii]MDY4504972.1 ABC transporter ATP-binding protein/permease [[Actinobacillus] rossii]SUT89215.1 ABC transporter [[Actinobacillus] rossii]